LQFASLGSGSRGNSTLIRAGSTTLMVDLGYSTKETLLRLDRLSCDPDAIKAILVTHEHTDHILGVARFANKFNIPVYATAGTVRSNKLDKVEKLNYIDSHSNFSIGDIDVSPFPVPHDAEEPCQFVFEHNSLRLGLLTDTGSITAHIEAVLTQLDGLLLEFNHDIEMLKVGPYSAHLKNRVGGNYGHLNNNQALALLQQIDTSRLQTLVALHLSEKNNSLDLVYEGLHQAFPSFSSIFEIADQTQGLAWRQLKSVLVDC